MNPDFIPIITATLEDRRGLFLSTAQRLGTTLQNVEKDFWMCLVLDLLFNNRDINEPRLLFKGGTSLSKAFGLISRFSEDVDITVFREDIGQEMDIKNMANLSGKQQSKRLLSIKKSCQAYIQGQLKDRLNRKMIEIFSKVDGCDINIPVLQDPDDPDQQTLLVFYPSVNTKTDDYIKPAVKIEAGAKSALEPNQSTLIQPYVAQDLPSSNLTIHNVVTINAERTFWDKIIILHGLRRWYVNRGQLRQQGHRVSRHYYDVYKLMESPVGQAAKTNIPLGLECAHHARLFFNNKDLDLLEACPGTYTIMPTPEMIEVLRQDYKAMSGMIFGDVPDFRDVLMVINKLEDEINRRSRS